MGVESEIHNVNAGVKQIDLVKAIFKANERLQNKEVDKLVLFFDEINTNQNVQGLFKEVVIDRTLKGMRLHSNLVVIAAANPYRLKSHYQKNLSKNRPKILGNDYETNQLVYMVYPFP